VIILAEYEPRKNEITVNSQLWSLPYTAYTVIELAESIIIHYSWVDVGSAPPFRDFYSGRTIWCYKKLDQSVLWYIEEPPVARNNKGIIWNRSMILSNGEKFGDDEAYCGIHYTEQLDIIRVHTTGSRLFELNPFSGTVKLLQEGIK
jgi:hypothetical protein